MAHALLSPSGAHGWLRCADWQSNPRGSKSADEGTAAHELGAALLTLGGDAKDYPLKEIDVNGTLIRIDDEMREVVQSYVTYVRAIGGTLMVEQRLPLTPITGEVGAFGTSDAVIFADDELLAVDLKTGGNPNNKVFASEIVDGVERPNPQLGIYAAAALAEYEIVFTPKRVRMVIVQPRLQHVSEFTMTADELRAWAVTVKRADTVRPGEKQCQWCVHKPTCPTLAKFVTDSVGVEFDVIAVGVVPAVPSEGCVEPHSLSTKMQAVDLIEDWCKAVRAEVERRLLAGVPVAGYKLVEGRKGPRAWSDPEAAEKLLRETFRLPVEKAYDLKLISPTTAEKLHKAGDIGNRQWPKVVALVTQAEGKPSVAPGSDKRPALVVTPTADEFEDVSGESLV